MDMKHGAVLIAGAGALAVGGIVSVLVARAPTSASASGAASTSGAASASPSASSSPDAAPDDVTVDAGARWEVVLPLDEHLVGRWVDADKGDAIPRGPTGGVIVPGGVRAEFVRGKPGSRTPWNVTVWAPRHGHMTAETISLGCGFYAALNGPQWRTAYCRGYGLPAGGAHATTIDLETGPDGLSGQGARLRLRIGSLLRVVLVRAR